MILSWLVAVFAFGTHSRVVHVSVAQQKGTGRRWLEIHVDRNLWTNSMTDKPMHYWLRKPRALVYFGFLHGCLAYVLFLFCVAYFPGVVLGNFVSAVILHDRGGVRARRWLQVFTLSIDCRVPFCNIKGCLNHYRETKTWWMKGWMIGIGEDVAKMVASLFGCWST